MTVGLEELVGILKEAAPPDAPMTYDPDVPLVEAGLDSLDVSNFLLMVEERYGVQITNEDMEGLNTLNEVAAFLNQRKGR